MARLSLEHTDTHSVPRELCRWKTNGSRSQLSHTLSEKYASLTSTNLDDYSCTQNFIDTQSLDGFDALGAVLNQLYRDLQTFAVN